jgi:choline dehydrogenase-like flavoprotein
MSQLLPTANCQLSTDVAVIGAGLAGLRLARLLAARGLRVALLDRKPSIAAPVHTTGIFVRKTWEDFPLPEEQLGPAIRDVVLYSPSRSSLHIRAHRDEFRVGRMSWLYLQMLDQCASAGVQWISARASNLAMRTGHVRSPRRRVSPARLPAARTARAPRRAALDSIGIARCSSASEIVHRSRASPCCTVSSTRASHPATSRVANDGHARRTWPAGYRRGHGTPRRHCTFATVSVPLGRLLLRRGGLIP